MTTGNIMYLSGDKHSTNHQSLLRVTAKTITPEALREIDSSGIASGPLARATLSYWLDKQSNKLKHYQLNSAIDPDYFRVWLLYQNESIPARIVNTGQGTEVRPPYTIQTPDGQIHLSVPQTRLQPRFWPEQMPSMCWKEWANVHK